MPFNPLKDIKKIKFFGGVLPSGTPLRICPRHKAPVTIASQSLISLIKLNIFPQNEH